MKKGSVAVLSLVAGGIIGGIGIGKIMGKGMAEQKMLSGKHFTLFKLMGRWVGVKQEGKSLASYFEWQGYRRVAIYGMGYVGETLLMELKGTDVEVVYGIDKNAGEINLGLDIMTADDGLKEVDAIVVTAITYYEEIEQELSKKVGCPIISLEDILYEM